MSQESSSEKTEDATPKKLRDARKRGQVARSKDIPSALILIAIILYFVLSWNTILENLKETFNVISTLLSYDFGVALSGSLKVINEKIILEIILPFSLVVTVAAILGNIGQFGFLFSFDSMKPDFAKINPAEGMKRIFSVKQLVETLLSLLKTIVISIIMLYVVYIGIKLLLNDVQQCNVLCQQFINEDLISKLFLYIIPAILVMAVVDFIFQRQQFLKEQRMTKEELKREFKEMFGDPHVVGERRNLRRELAEQDIQKRIKTARLVIVDIGVAIALQFEQGVTPLPLIAAIGRGPVARRMLEIAQIENVPTIQNPKLAQLLLEEGKVDQYIPTSSIEGVAQAMRQNPKR
ncbi:MAG: EscU/YscU/HrcU family type III secretion system export apparatus switch protein [Thiofilum sp.]|uniref:EscU/YscU/HrcU family type III secretion system export apparatus switch protein n=1 Tax=Thiofilum sp. TaxID=2212733 RepID=UPI0025E22BAB|nr:EscU/YscU/HrcU family type III secretion system export apparatus switch protein [Thiofilum sp.]MBK8453153.1 EscU/YscU/HrcU family type III secretion system export apparatus switch protein [Thiofilum sp.]